MVEQILIIVFLAVYLAPQMAPNFRWLGAIAALLGAAALVAWFTWVAGQTSSIGAGVAGLIVLVAALTAGVGVLVRAVVLWRGWNGTPMVLAVVAGCGLLVGGLVLTFRLG
ncbi:MAG: hypothetical protein MUF73_12160 [Rhodobacteraceae bacterium]|jgi:hypothetical protein|nr:hypothetical protein [Paracoccaceae bacterium]